MPRACARTVRSYDARTSSHGTVGPARDPRSPSVRSSAARRRGCRSGTRSSAQPVGTDPAARSNVDLQARVGSAGTLKARGDFSMQPMSLQLELQLQRLALAGFDPYLAERLALGIDEGSLDTTGKLRYEGGRVAYTGRLEVAGMRSRERQSGIETIRWKRLLLDGIDVDVDPAQLGPKDSITIGGKVSHRM